MCVYPVFFFDARVWCVCVCVCASCMHHNLKIETPSARMTRVVETVTAETLNLEEFAPTLTPTGAPCERVVVCVVHEDDANELDEPFYLARIVSTARKISKDCIVGGNHYPSGHLVVNIKWLLIPEVIEYTNYNRGVKKVLYTVLDLF